MLTLYSAALTHPGRVRANNEDSMLATERFVAVADGLGGHAAGEVASRIAVDCIRALAERDGISVDDIVATIAQANAMMIDEGARQGEHLGMGTTLAGVGLLEPDGDARCVVFNIGDSRVYRYAGGTLAQLSVDHSEVEELRAAGLIDAEQAARHPRRNVVTRCLGTQASPSPDVWILEPEHQARFLVCSDGLTGEVDDARIAELLGLHPHPADAARALLDEALAAGGHDNVTIVVADLSLVETPTAPLTEHQPPPPR